MRKIKSAAISLALITILSSQLFSCGYLLHPERRNQKSGHIDWAIVGLDAIGLLFFIIPGLIAFGVDIASGTIYMSSNNHSFSNLEFQEYKKIKIKGEVNEKNIIAAINESTGIVIDFDNPNLKIIRDDQLKSKLVFR
jgi:hypothetical protein